MKIKIEIKMKKNKKKSQKKTYFLKKVGRSKDFFFGDITSTVFKCMSDFSLSSAVGRKSCFPSLIPTIVKCLPVAAPVRTVENPTKRKKKILKMRIISNDELRCKWE